jgi:hypothetical protein
MKILHILFKLKITLRVQDAIPVMVSGARLFIAEDETRIIDLKNIGSGG